MMTKSSKNKDAAWKFLTFYYMNYDGAAGKLYGEIPTNIDAMKEDWIQNTTYIKTGADLMASKDTKLTDNPVYMPGYTGIQQTMEPMVQKVMAKKMTAKEMLDEWAKLLEKEKATFDASTTSK